MANDGDSWLAGIGVDVSSIVKKVQETATAVADKASDAASGAVKTVTTTATSAADSVKSAASSVVDTVKTTATSAVETAKSTASGAYDAASGVVRKVEEKYFEDFVRTKDLYLFLGTTHEAHIRKFTNPYVIIGTFHPPHVMQRYLL